MKKYWIVSLIFISLFSCSETNTQKVGGEEQVSIAVSEEGKNEVKQELSIWDTVRNKVNWFVQDKPSNRDLKRIPVDFLQFYNLFIEDSNYQKQHIDFSNLIGVYGECDTTIRITEDNWIVTDWNFLDFFNVDNNTDAIQGWDNRFYFNSKIFYYQFDLKEVGTIYEVGFEKNDESWEMTLYSVHSC